MNMRKHVVSLLIFGSLAIPLEARGQGPPVYVSTFNGSQILKVDGTTGATTVLFTDPNSDSLEGLAIGPDDLIYACAPGNHSIIRVDQSGSLDSFASVLTSQTLQPEGPSFNTAGKLFFNTRGKNGVWDITFSSSDTPSAPTQVIPDANGATDGEGTTFGAQDQLLIVDRGSNLVLQSTAPPATSPLLSGLSTPIGIAVNAAGENFVANLGTQKIERFSSAGSHLSTYADFSFGGTDSADHPFYLQFDASGVLYVVTANTDGTGGKVWRVVPDPEVSGLGDPTCLVDLGAAYASQISAPISDAVTCSANTVTGTLSSGDATGLAVPPTSITTPDQGVTAGTLAIFPFGNSTTEKMKVLYPTGAFDGTIQMFAKFTEISPADFFTDTSNLLESPASLSANTSGKVCIPWANTGGNCIIAELECDPAPCPTTSGFDPNTTGSTHNSQDIQISATFVTNFPISNPDLLTADDGSFSYLSIFTDFYPLSIDPTIKGGTNGFNSDFVTTDDEITASSSPTTAAKFLGFQTPLALKNAKVFTSGDTLAVRFTVQGLTNSFDPTQVVARISVEMLSSAQNTNAANFKSIPNNQFVYNSGKNNYQFYLSLAGYAPGTYTLLVTSNSFAVQQVTFTVH